MSVPTSTNTPTPPRPAANGEACNECGHAHLPGPCAPRAVTA